MHTFGESTGGVPAFLAKLWRLVEDEETNDLINWSSDGRSFTIQNQARFAKELLPLNYKHNNMASFIRQLNMYGFHKIASIDNGGLKFDRDEMEFSHPCFQQGHPYLLEHIKRKIANPKVADDKTGGLKVEAVNHVLNEVKTMRGRQDSLDSRFSSMKQENEALWREVAILRQKHMKQQQIVNKLIQFLVTIVQPQRTGLGPMNKRRYQLMINDTPQTSKVKKTDTGPIIQELTEELLESAVSDNEADEMEMHVRSPSSSGSRTRNTSATYHHEDEDVDIDAYTATTPRKSKILKSDSVTEDAVTEYVIDYDIPDHVPPTTTVPQMKQEAEVTETKLRIQLQNRQKHQQEMLKLQQQQQRDQLEQEFRHQHEQEVMQETIKQEHIVGHKRIRLSNQNKRFIVNTKNGKSLLNPMKKPKIATFIKQEQDEVAVDPMSFITMMDDVEQQQVELQASTSIVEAATNINDPQHDASVARIEEFLKDVTSEDTMGAASGKDMYTKDSFMSPEMPNDLFDNGVEVKADESPMLGGFSLNGGAYNPNLYFDTTGKQDLKPQQFSSSTATTSTASTSDDNKAIVPKLQTNGVHPENILRFNSRNDIDNHLNNVETDLDTLKDLLRGEGYQFDANSLLGHPADNNARQYYLPQSAFDPDTISKLFGSEDVLSYEVNSNNAGYSQDKRSNESASGTELISYQPCQADLSDLLGMENGSIIDYERSVSPRDVLDQQ